MLAQIGELLVPALYGAGHGVIGQAIGLDTVGHYAVPVCRFSASRSVRQSPCCCAPELLVSGLEHAPTPSVVAVGCQPGTISTTRSAPSRSLPPPSHPAHYPANQQANQPLPHHPSRCPDASADARRKPQISCAARNNRSIPLNWPQTLIGVRLPLPLPHFVNRA